MERIKDLKEKLLLYSTNKRDYLYIIAEWYKEEEINFDTFEILIKWALF